MSFAVWLTGLSGSGKSAIARELVRLLHDLMQAQETGGLLRRESGLDVREIGRASCRERV